MLIESLSLLSPTTTCFDNLAYGKVMPKLINFLMHVTLYMELTLLVLRIDLEVELQFTMNLKP